MRKFLYMLAALLVLIGINTYDVEARTRCVCNNL